MEDTMTMAEVAKAIKDHFGGNRFLATQGVLSFLEEYSEEEGGTYDTALVQEWLDR